MRHFALLWLLLPLAAQPAILTRSGSMTLDETWTAGNTYHITGDVTVEPGVTLTIQAGAVVKLSISTSLFVDGTLIASGTAGSPIYITSDDDETVGEDTDIGTSTTGAPGQWRDVVINGSATIDHTQFRFGGNTNFARDTLLYVGPGATLDVSNSTFASSAEHGIRIEGSNPTLASCTFQDNLNAAISMNVASDPTITSPTLSNNGTNGVAVDGGTTTASTAFDDPDIVYRLRGPYTVGAPHTLAVAAGQVVKLDISIDLFVNGTLTATGTLANPVIFTSDEDDSIGGDTNNDGAASMPAPGDWRQIRVDGAATMSHVEIRYSGNSNFASDAALYVQNGATLDIDNCVVRDSAEAGIRMVNADPTIDSCSFTDNLGPAMRMNVDSNPVVTAPSFTNNATNGVLVDGGVTTIDTAFDDPDVVYRLGGGYTVGAAQTLTVAPGQVIKPSISVDLFVNGTLNAPGTAANPIILTSAEDDAAGGDTNNDSSATAPGPGDWRQIQVDGAATMSHVEIRYSGNSNFAFDAALYVQNGATLVIDNCLVSDSAEAGIRMVNADPMIDSCRFIDNATSALRANVDSSPAIFAPEFSNNGTNGLSIDGGTLGFSNTWDDPDVVRVLEGPVIVPAGLNLSITAGQVVKFRPSLDLLVMGTLTAVGTVSRPVVFTSAVDDVAGGDTNNDGNASTPGPGGWLEVEIDGGTATLENVVLRYGGNTNFGADSSLHVDSGALAVDGVIVADSQTAGVSCDQAGMGDLQNLLVYGGDVGVRARGGCTLDAVNATIDNHRIGASADNGTINLTNTIVSASTRAGLETVNGGAITATFTDLFNPEASLGDVAGFPDPVGSNGNISGDPAFLDPLGGDYRLLASSAAIDAGTSTAAPASDLLDNGRFDNLLVANSGGGSMPFVDIGALERQDGIPGFLLPVAAGDQPGDQLGSAISVDGNRVAVGIPSADISATDSGRVLLFELDGDRFVLTATIDVPAGFLAVNFGAALDLSGREILVGAPGTSSASAKRLAKGGGLQPLAAAVFEQISRTSWTMKTPVTPINGNTDDNFGASVALEGATVVIGAPGDDDGGTGAGAVHAYQFDGAAMVAQTKLMAQDPSAGAGFGTAVAMSGNRVAAGAPGAMFSGILSGSVTLFEQISNNLDSLAAQDTVAGSSSAAGDRFGHSVALAGDMLLAGAPMADAGASSDAGAAYLFDFSGMEIGRLSADAPGSDSHFGMAVAIAGDDLVAGAPGTNGGAGAVFRYDTTLRLIERIEAPAGSSGFGMSVARRDNVLAIGAPMTNAAEGAAFTQLRNGLLLFGDGFER